MASWPERLYWTAFTGWHALAEGRLPYRPLEEIQAIQNRRVRAIVRHAYDQVPHYREVMDQAGLKPEDFRSADDLAQLPILTGEQVADAPERFLSRGYRRGSGLTLHSSGSTGRPRTIEMDRFGVFMVLVAGQRQRAVMAHWLGRNTRYREMSIGRAAGTNATMRAFYERHSWLPKRLDLERAPLNVADRFEDNLARLNAFKPDVLFGIGSYAGELFRWAWEHGAPIHRPKLLWYGADPILEPDRRLIEEEYGIPIWSTYQAIETPRLAFQCELRRGFHLSLDQVAVRVVDDAGRPVPPGGRGHIIVSSLINRATVVLNYRLGDIVTLSKEPCPCGRTLPTLEHIDGREYDRILAPDGQYHVGMVILPALFGVPGLKQVQVIQEELRRLHVRVVPQAGADEAAVRAEVVAVLRRLIGAEIEVNVEFVSAIPRQPSGKIRPLISCCRRENALP